MHVRHNTKSDWAQRHQEKKTPCLILWIIDDWIIILPDIIIIIVIVILLIILIPKIIFSQYVKNKFKDGKVNNGNTN